MYASTNGRQKIMGKVWIAAISFSSRILDLSPCDHVNRQAGAGIEKLWQIGDGESAHRLLGAGLSKVILQFRRVQR
jgi:hypothetical protein